MCPSKLCLFRIYYDLKAAIGFMPVEVNIIPIGKPIKEQKLQTVSTLMVSLTVKILFFSDHFPLRKYEKKTSLFLLHSPYESDFKGFGLPHLSMVDWTQ